MSNYETPEIVAEYLVFHYGNEADILPYDFGPKTALGFPVRCVRNLIAPAGCSGGSDQAFGLAYDLGCAVGRSTFELARYATTVRGFDLSAGFIDAANVLLDRGGMHTDVAVEGDIKEQIDIRAPALPDGSDIGFAVGDAIELGTTLEPADIVLAANLLCRLPTPETFLRSMQRLVKPGGQLLLVTPFTWLESFTPRSAWPRDEAGNAMRGSLWVEGILGDGFTLEHTEELPFLIREHARKFQWTVSFGMRWRRQAA